MFLLFAYLNMSSAVVFTHRIHWHTRKLLIFYFIYLFQLEANYFTIL